MEHAIGDLRWSLTRGSGTTGARSGAHARQVDHEASESGERGPDLLRVLFSPREKSLALDMEASGQEGLAAA
ncbi:LOW QUALITY PROTEIN: hypothetical protein HJFPF1_08128 [Paramyrothecium foliicola]|nr:LOW QUALITY PROTEIN: hypothetical protein HJFPF1_08128 [Paramyrothecium foliicola]